MSNINNFMSFYACDAETLSDLGENKAVLSITCCKRTKTSYFDSWVYLLIIYFFIMMLGANVLEFDDS